MPSFNMLQAKTHLSRLVESIESGKETEIVIARNGRPAAKLVAIDAAPRSKVRLGLFKGEHKSLSLAEFNEQDAYIERLFYGEEQ